MSHQNVVRSLVATVLMGFFAAPPRLPGQQSTQPEARGPRAQLLQRLEQLAEKPMVSEQAVTDLRREVAQQLEKNAGDPVLLYWQAELIGRGPDAAAAQKAFLAARAAARKIQPSQAGIEARCLRSLARLALTEDRRVEAAGLARQSLALEPGSVAGHRLLLDCCLRGGNPLELVDEFRRAAEQPGSDQSAMQTLYFELLATVGAWESLRSAVEAKLQQTPYEADAHHYRGMLAALDNRPMDAFVEHYLAVELGQADRPTIQQSRSELDAFVQKDDVDAPAPLRALVLGFRDANRKSQALQALAAVDGVQWVKQSAASFVAGMLKVTALGELGRHTEAAEVGASLGISHPAFADFPALKIGLGESLEALGQTKQAAELFAAARRLAPQCAAVRRIFRLGCEFRSVKDGVEVVAIAKDSPMELAGVAVGDTLLELDREVLEEMPAFNRLRAVRLYFGGIITLRTKHGETAKREMDLVYFRY